MRGGQTNFAVNQMKIAKVAACAISVRLMFITPVRSALANVTADDGEQRIAEREQHRQTDADDERRVDQAEQQEHLGLQRRDQLGLARAGFEKAAAHDADADTRAGGAQADHEADADAGVGLDHGQQLHFFHLGFLSVEAGEWLMVSLVALVRHRQIDDGEHHEDEGLQHDDQDVEYRPAHAQHRCRRSCRPARSRPTSTAAGR